MYIIHPASQTAYILLYPAVPSSPSPPSGLRPHTYSSCIPDSIHIPAYISRFFVCLTSSPARIFRIRVEECRNRPDRTHLMHPAIRVAQQRPAFGVVVSVVAMNYYVCIFVFTLLLARCGPLSKQATPKWRARLRAYETPTCCGWKIQKNPPAALLLQ